MFFGLIRPIIEKKNKKKKKKTRVKSKFSRLAKLFKHFFIDVRSNMSEQEMKLSEKNFRNNWSFFMAPINPRP